MEKTKAFPLFQPAVPGNAEHAPLIRQEALDWLETHFSEMRTFSASNVLQMAGEQSRRWLMTRIRAQGIGQSDEMPPTEAADALTVLFLRSRGIKFADAIDAVASAQAAFPSIGQSFGGIWNRLMLVSLERMQRLVPPRVLGAAIASLLGVENGPPNALVIVRPLTAAPSSSAASAADVTPERAYQSVLERPLPVIAVISPSGELVLFGEGQSPAISEFRSRTLQQDPARKCPVHERASTLQNLHDSKGCLLSLEIDLSMVLQGRARMKVSDLPENNHHILHGRTQRGHAHQKH